MRRSIFLKSKKPRVFSVLTFTVHVLNTRSECIVSVMCSLRNVLHYCSVLALYPDICIYVNIYMAMRWLVCVYMCIIWGVEN